MSFKKFEPLPSLTENEPLVIIVISEDSYKIMGQEKEFSDDMLVECLESIAQGLKEKA